MIYIQGVRSPYAYFGTRQKPRENGVFGVFIGQIGSSWGQNIILIKIREEITVKRRVYMHMCMNTRTQCVYTCVHVYMRCVRAYSFTCACIHAFDRVFLRKQ